jgi:putative transport protein
MDVFQQLLCPGSESLASTLVLYSFVIAAGIYLGKMKIGGISLGVTFVLFVGIIMGHLGYVVNGEVLHFIREFGLILFIFAIGLQVGPAFFSSFKEGGIRMNLMAVGIVMLNVAIVITLYYTTDASIIELVGVMSGAVTNTPGLAAAQQAVAANPAYPDAANTLSMGYAAAYPLGVCGIILAMLVIRWVFKVNTADESQKLVDEANKSVQAPMMQTIQVTNELVNGRTIAQLLDIVHCDFVVSRLLNAYNEVIIPTSKTVVHTGDRLLVVMNSADESTFTAVLGPLVEMKWEETQADNVVSRRIALTQSKYNGVTIGSLRLHSAYQLNATRVNRAGVDLLASPDLRLQIGDRITVVGSLADIDRLADKLGNSMKRLNQPNLITIFVGILVGVLVGSLNVGYGMKLGLAGGPLVVAILFSRFGYKLKLVTYTSTSASMLMRELGICLFLASVGISSGKNFAATVFNTTGMWWVIWGFIITLVPLLIIGFIARKVYKMNYLHIMGMLSGACTDPPALAYAGNSTGSDAPAVAYSTVYPLTMFLRVVAAQALILIFLH